MIHTYNIIPSKRAKNKVEIKLIQKRYILLELHVIEINTPKHSVCPPLVTLCMGSGIAKYFKAFYSLICRGKAMEMMVFITSRFNLGEPH